MSSHFKFHDGMGEVVPFNARYQYPTQANRAWKNLVKISPKNGSTFKSNMSTAPIRIELPAQGYLDTSNSFLTFDVAIQNRATTYKNTRFQNNIQSIFKRVRLVYGSLVLEDIADYNVIVRMMTEAAGTNTINQMDHSAVSEGIGGSMLTPSALTASTMCYNNTRAEFIQCSDPLNSDTNGRDKRGLVSFNGQALNYRRYQVQLALGLFQQNKLLPLKWMASQLSLELELASFGEACCAETTAEDAMDTYYQLDNIAFLAHINEFDGSYDAAFLEGLRGEGVPIKFASWDTFQDTPSGGNRQTLMIPERNRSLKAIFNVLVPNPRSGTGAGSTGGNPHDSHAFLNSCNTVTANGADPPAGKYAGFVQNFQFRIGGKMYPSQPIVCGSGGRPNGGAEAYIEFAKALNIVGDYRLSTPITPSRWQLTYSDATTGAPSVRSHAVDWPTAEKAKDVNHSYHYGNGPSFFVIAADLETSRGSEVSGLNGEEQNDIALMIEYNDKTDQTVASYKTFVYYDALLVLRENNLVELIK